VEATLEVHLRRVEDLQVARVEAGAPVEAYLVEETEDRRLVAGVSDIEEAIAARERFAGEAADQARLVVVAGKDPTRMVAGCDRDAHPPTLNRVGVTCHVLVKTLTCLLAHGAAHRRQQAHQPER